MPICDAPSMGDFQGGATYFGRGGQVSTAGSHKCELEPGHSGPHAKQTLSPVSAVLAMCTTYTWSDEHALTARVAWVPIKTTIEAASYIPTAGTA